MHKACPNCGQKFNFEPGFYYGAAYVSYAINVIIFLSLWVISELLHISETKDQVLFIILIACLLVPYTFTLSRALWLSFFVRRTPKSS